MGQELSQAVEMHNVSGMRLMVTAYLQHLLLVVLEVLAHPRICTRCMVSMNRTGGQSASARGQTNRNERDRSGKEDPNSLLSMHDCDGSTCDVLTALKGSKCGGTSFLRVADHSPHDNFDRK